jgi:hypothetical protein
MEKFLQTMRLVRELLWTGVAAISLLNQIMLLLNKAINYSHVFKLSLQIPSKKTDNFCPEQ